MEPRQHPAGQRPRREPVLHERACCVIGTLTRAANDQDLPIAGKLIETRPELAKRYVERARHALHGEFTGLAHIEQERAALSAASQ